VHIGHSGNPLENEGELRDVQKLLTSLIFELHPLRPSLDGRALLRDDYVVGWLRHFILLRLTADRILLRDLIWLRRGASQYDLRLTPQLVRDTQFAREPLSSICSEPTKCKPVARLAAFATDYKHMA
jgi:hypothetical protein